MLYTALLISASLLTPVLAGTSRLAERIQRRQDQNRNSQPLLPAVPAPVVPFSITNGSHTVTSDNWAGGVLSRSAVSRSGTISKLETLIHGHFRALGNTSSPSSSFQSRNSRIQARKLRMPAPGLVSTVPLAEARFFRLGSTWK